MSRVECRLVYMSLRHAMLGMLSDGPASGYDLLKVFDTSLAHVWPATQSQIYGELAKLADAGFVTVDAEGPRGRKEYAITDAGLAELRHWLIEVEPEPVRRSGMLLRVFFLDKVSREEAIGYLRHQAESAAEQHRELSKIVEAVESDGDPLARYGRLALEWGLRAAAMREGWATWAEGETAKMTD